MQKMSPTPLRKSSGRVSSEASWQEERQQKVSEGHPEQIECTPTDPSLEFDTFEVVRVRMVEALEGHGYDLLQAERIALYVVEGAKPVSRLLKVTARESAPAHEEVLEALGNVLHEVPALEKAKRLFLHIDEAPERD
jgi:hypothetical protein